MNEMPFTKTLLMAYIFPSSVQLFFFPLLFGFRSEDHSNLPFGKNQLINQHSKLRKINVDD